MNGKGKTSYLNLRDAVIASARNKSVQTKLEERQSERLDSGRNINTKIVETRKAYLTRLAKQKKYLFIWLEMLK
jgi:hypothetical protein